MADARPRGSETGNSTLTFRGAAADITTPVQGPLAGVDVCIVDKTGKNDATVPCTTTDSQGAFELRGLPRNSELIARFSKPGYDPVVNALDAKEADLRLFAEFIGMDDAYTKRKTFARREAPDGSSAPTPPMDPNGGALVLFAIQPAATPPGTAGNSLDWAVGTRVAIKPAIGDGPFFFDPDPKVAGQTDPDAKSIVGGGAIYLNLPPGDYEVTFTHPTLPCSYFPSNVYGFDGGPNTIRAPVFAATWTSTVGVFCQ
jgi:hypothetical protein